MLYSNNYFMRNLLILIIIPIIIYSQNYNGPESIEYNSNNGSYYISNSNNGQILELNNDNDLSVFTSNINTGGPHGLELVDEFIGPKLVGQTLFVCSGSNLLGYNWFGNQILNYDMDGVFLNGITQRWEGDENDIIDLFITDFSGKTACCGFPILFINQANSMKMVANHTGTAKDKGADAMVTPCPLCHLNLDGYQAKARRQVRNDKADLPIIHVPQLIGLAMGMKEKELGLQKHIVSTKDIVKKVEQISI